MTVAFYLPGNVPVYAYPLLVGSGAALGLLWVAWRTQEHGFTRVDAGLVALFGALLGARLGFVAINWSTFQASPGEALQLFQGGLVWPGAIAGALLGTALVSRWVPGTFADLCDDLLPLTATVTVSAWLGCWLDGCAYGPLAPNDWWGIPTRDAWGTVASRWPTQLFGALLALALFWVLDLARERLRKPGLKASLGFALLFLQLIGLSFLRADPAPRWIGLRAETWAALGFTGLALINLGWTLRAVRQSRFGPEPAELTDPGLPPDPSERLDTSEPPENQV